MAMRLAGESSPADSLIDILTTKGDLFIRGTSEIERLAIGAKRFFPRVNEAGDGLEYVKSYEFGMNMSPWQWEIDFYEWTTTVTGSGSIYKQGYGTFHITTGTTASSTARGRGYQFGWISWDQQNLEWYLFGFHRANTANGQTWIKLDEDTAADPTAQAVGWRIDDDALKGIVHNGTSLTVVDLGVTWGLNIGRELFIKFVAGDKIYWYVDGVEKGSSSSIPSTMRMAVVYPVVAVANNGDSAEQGLEVSRHGWIADIA